MKLLSHKWQDEWKRTVECKNENCLAKWEIELADLKYLPSQSDGPFYHSAEYFYTECQLCKNKIVHLNDDIPPAYQEELKNNYKSKSYYD
jgi:hypothetical protein